MFGDERVKYPLQPLNSTTAKSCVFESRKQTRSKKIVIRLRHLVEPIEKYLDMLKLGEKFTFF
jgi:hypothetical protein